MSPSAIELRAAIAAPRRPEAQHDDLAAVLRQTHVLAGDALQHEVGRFARRATALRRTRCPQRRTRPRALCRIHRALMRFLMPRSSRNVVRSSAETLFRRGRHGSMSQVSVPLSGTVRGGGAGNVPQSQTRWKRASLLGFVRTRRRAATPGVVCVRLQGSACETRNAAKQARSACRRTETAVTRGALTLTDPRACVVEQALPRRALAPLGGMPRKLHGAEHALGVRHHDRHAAVGIRTGPRCRSASRSGWPDSAPRLAPSFVTKRMAASLRVAVRKTPARRKFRAAFAVRRRRSEYASPPCPRATPTGSARSRRATGAPRTDPTDCARTSAKSPCPESAP